MFMRNDRKFRDCSAIYVTCWKIDRQSCRHLKLARKNGRLVSSPASHHGLAKSATTFILKAIVYEERRAFGMIRKITVTIEILG